MGECDLRDYIARLKVRNTLRSSTLSGARVIPRSGQGVDDQGLVVGMDAQRALASYRPVLRDADTLAFARDGDLLRTPDGVFPVRILEEINLRSIQTSSRALLDVDAATGIGTWTTFRLQTGPAHAIVRDGSELVLALVLGSE